MQMLNAPGTVTKSLPVIVEIVGPAQLTLSPLADGVSTTPALLAYTKGQAGIASTTVTVKSTPNLYFTVDTTSLPNWLTVNYTNGQATAAGFPLIFTVTKVADTLTPGTYPGVGTPQQVFLNVAGYATTTVYISLTVQNTAPNLTVAEGMARNLVWSAGPLPTATITAVSSGAAIPFTLSTTNPATNGANPSAVSASNVAFSFGTAIDVTFDPLAFAGAQPGSTLSGTVTLNWTGVAIPVVFNISIQAPSSKAILTGITPPNLPSGPPGTTFNVMLYGSGFVSSTDPTLATTVGVVSSGVLKTDANIGVTVVNGSTISLVITVPALLPVDALLPFATANSIVSLGVCNPGGTTCTTATGTLPLTIGAGPTIQPGGVTSASTFVSVVSPTGTLAPYDIISIFGSNFCVSAGTGCTNGQVLYAPLTATLVYGTILTPDAGQRNLQVFFYNQGQTVTGPGAAPLLFATNNQINLVVPSGIVTGSQYDIVVKFGTLVSSAYTFTAALNDPGIFAVDSASPAQGAIILPSGVIADVSNAGRMRVVGTDSDIVSIFMTGLGLPVSAAANTSGGTSTPIADCLSPANYKTAEGILSLDGAVIQSSLIYPGRLVPCFDQTSFLTVKVGNLTATPKFAGWAPDAIAGLYQVNAQLPAYGGGAFLDPSGNAITLPLTVPVEVPVLVTITTGGKTTQTNIAMWVQPAQTLKALAPGVYPFLVSALTGAVGTPVALDTVTATGGTTPGYTVTAVTGSDSVGPALLTDFAVDAAAGTVTIKRAFLAGTFSVTITATDGSVPAFPTEAITLIVKVTVT